MRHVRRGWQALEASEQEEVRGRVETTMAAHRFGAAHPQSLRHFFAFLAQVETIAIEIPLRFLPVAPDHVKPLLRRQLVDEVFHSTLFARLAHELSLPDAQPGAPLASAERLLDRIRAEQDLSVSATLLNLVAEGWIENLFKHALRWGIADAVFEAVLEDETRHVHEAQDYIDGLDGGRARDAVHALEQGLMEVSAEPTVGLAILDLAGDDGYRALVEDLHRTHREQLALAGLEPSAQWQQIESLADAGIPVLDPDAPQARPDVLADTPWRRAARQVWDTPRDPTMQGDFDVPVGHIPKKLLTPVMVAALGAAWAEEPELNRVLVRDRRYQLPQVNVGVRVLVAEDELATVVVTHADQRSVQDISRMIVDGVRQLEAARKHRIASGITAPDPIPDDVMAMAGPRADSAFAVALSNPGKFGMVAGAGSFSGALAPSTDISVGQRRRMPAWKGLGYWPSWHVNMGSLQDHRLFDGKQAGIAMSALRRHLSRKGVKAILRRPDTLSEASADIDYEQDWMALMPPALRMVPMTGFAKYYPVVLGGAGLATMAGVGGFFLYSHLARTNAAAQQQQQMVVIQKSGDSLVLEPLMADGSARCRAVEGGAQCMTGASHGLFCAAHDGFDYAAHGIEEVPIAGAEPAGTADAAAPEARTADVTPSGKTAEAPRLASLTAAGEPRCQAILKTGVQCTARSKQGAFCGRHG